MKTSRHLLAAAASALLLAPLAMAQDAEEAPAKSDQPTITFENTVINLGEVVKGKTAEFTFKFKNTGSTALEIKQAKPSCGCTVADFTRSVPPGGSGKVTARVDTKRFKGPITKTVTVTSNDPATPTVHLQAKATVKALIDVSPSEHVYFRVYRGDDVPTKRVLTITGDADNPFEIEKVESTNPSVTTKLVNLAGDSAAAAADKSSHYQLEIDVTRDAPLGQLTGIVTLATTHPKVPKITLNINGQVLGEVIVTPQKVYLGQVTKSTAASVKRTVRIERRKGGGFKIEKVESTNPKIKAEVAAVEDGKIYTLTIRMSEDLDPGAVNANIVVSTNDEEQPSIEIPVIGTIRG